MDLPTLLMIAVGLAMDAFAVSICSGLVIERLRLRDAVRIAFSFGAFQALMPVFGWLAGLAVSDVIQKFDHWAAFGLLALIGSKMIYEANRGGHKPCRSDPRKLVVLLALSVATSIDALAVGVTFAFLDVSIAVSAAVIGVVTFLLSLAGVYIGRRTGHRFERKAETAGGLILIAIGAKILIKHTLL